MKQHEIRAARDKALKAAFVRLDPGGTTAYEIALMAGKVHRETLRAILEDLVHARVLLVERSPRNNLYRPAPNWAEEFDAYIKARDARIYSRRVDVEEDDDAAPGPGVPLVAYAMRHQPASVWALARHA